RFVRSVQTAPSYSLFALDTTPPKPGLVPRRDPGASIAGEVWRISPVGLTRFLSALPAPMTLGAITLSDGESVIGFSCTADALEGAREITEFGSWPEYLAQRAV